MRLGFFSPMPPSRSGIADYSAALLDHWPRPFEIRVFDHAPEDYAPASFDIALYQIGNNPHHAFVYETALQHPGVIVLHEFNLHHLIAELTIKRGDWDAYLREVEYEGGPVALDYARRVRALKAGPDYDGLPMLRRILERSRAVVVHSRTMARQVREAGFERPIAQIPHGAWISDADRMGYRHRLGVDETTPLVGIFGFLKPYKRIAESLRAFRRLLRVTPRAKMILVGEQHPDLPLESLLESLDLTAAVRPIGFTAIEDFTGHLAACDVVLNLRYPTVGEISGTLLRSLGLGKATLVSDIGSFQELPDDVCLKVPIDAAEEDLLFEYMNLLACRPDLRAELGARARKWVEEECNWDRVARAYSSFLDSVVHGREWKMPERERTAPAPEKAPPVRQDYILDWSASGGAAREYAHTHLSRLQKTLRITPRGGAQDRVLEMGTYLQITPALRTKLGYGEVRCCYYGPLGEVERRSVSSADGETFECDIDLFDAEKDTFPYPDEFFSTVLCCELIEHLAEDPMHMMAEVNRILRSGGHLVLTTPNIGSLRAMSAILQGYHPGFFPAYIRPGNNREEAARHNREYTPREIARLLADAGFEVTLLETGPFRDEPKPEHGWVVHALERYGLPTELRGDGIYAVGRKTGPIRDRHPAWLFN